jgi:hypothetical protein
MPTKVSWYASGQFVADGAVVLWKLALGDGKLPVATRLELAVAGAPVAAPGLVADARSDARSTADPVGDAVMATEMWLGRCVAVLMPAVAAAERVDVSTALADEA